MKRRKTKVPAVTIARHTGDPWPQETAKLHAAYDSMADQISLIDQFQLLDFWNSHRFTNSLGASHPGPCFVLIENYHEYGDLPDMQAPCAVRDGGVFHFDLRFVRESSLLDVSYSLFLLMAEAMTYVEGTRTSDPAVNKALVTDIVNRWMDDPDLNPVADHSNN